jgi:hypothetical protein
MRTDFVISMTLALLIVAGCRTRRDAGDLKFYGADSRRAVMTLETNFLYRIPEDMLDKKAEEIVAAHGQDIDDQRDVQLAHLYGVFTQHTKPFDFVKNPGIPRQEPKITLLSVNRVQGKPYLNYSYRYEDIVVFRKSIFHGNSVTNIKFALPREPGPDGLTIYQKGCPRPKEGQDTCAASDINRCTDHHYNSAGDYWYFWNPFQTNEDHHIEPCPLTASDLVMVEAQMKPLNSTANTFPEYKKLFDSVDGKGIVRINYLVGVDDNFSSTDLGKQGFLKAYKLLTQGRAMLSAADSLAILTDNEKKLLAETDDLRFTDRTTDGNPRHKTLEYVNDRDGYKVLLNMYLADPNADVRVQSDPNSYSFVDVAVKGMREADVFIYNGHSGLGGHMSIDRLFKGKHFTLPEDKYQIFVFNGCSTFSYYNSSYFNLKATAADPKGIANLDIVTAGIGAPFDTGPGIDTWLIRDLVGGGRPSWQAIMDRAYNLSPEESALLQVNGDENNPHDNGK